MFNTLNDGSGAPGKSEHLPTPREPIIVSHFERRGLPFEAENIRFEFSTIELVDAASTPLYYE